MGKDNGKFAKTFKRILKRLEEVEKRISGELVVLDSEVHTYMGVVVLSLYQSCN